MICPSCGAEADPIAQARDIAVCAHCAETVAIHDSGAQKAAFSDVQKLSDVEFQTLRKARASVLAKKPKA